MWKDETMLEDGEMFYNENWVNEYDLGGDNEVEDMGPILRAADFQGCDNWWFGYHSEIEL